MTIGLTGALVGGLLTLLSPCSVMLLPSFFAYAFTSPGRLRGIGVGVLLNATQGTASLTGVLGAADQAALEASVLRAAGTIPDLALVGVAIVALVAAWSVHAARSRRATPRAAAQAAAEQAEPAERSGP